MAQEKLVSTIPAEKPSADAPIEGRFITLEKFKDEHVSDLWRYFNNDDFWRYLPGKRDDTEDEFRANFHQTAEENIVLTVMGDPNHLGPSSGKHGTELAQRREALGVVVWGDINTEQRTLEAGALFGTPLRRTVAATEANYLLLRGVFDPPHGPSYRRMSWKTNTGNTFSRRGAERLGYVYEGTWRNHMIDKGRNRDSAWFSVIEDDWPAIKAALEQWLDPTNFNEDGSQIKRLQDIRASLK